MTECINRKWMKLRFTKFLIIIMALVLSGCSILPNSSTLGSASLSNASAENAEKSAGDTEALEAIDTAIVIALDIAAGKIVLQNYESGRRYELSYDGRTYFYDNYGQMMTAQQVNTGDIADVILSVHSGYLKQLTLSKDTFVLREVEEHVFNENKQMLTIGKENYRLPERLVVIINGEVGKISDINEKDVLTFRGIDRTVLTCIVEKGHGYLKVKGNSELAGGWIEIGDTIKPISEEKMLLLVPEGEYDMHVSYHGRYAEKHVKIERDEETSVNISDLKDEIVQTGMVTFRIDPLDAKLYLNGEQTDFILPVELEYGIYRMTVAARGYVTVNKYISVHEEEEEINLYLESEDEDSSKSKSSSASTGNIDYVTPSYTAPASSSESSSLPQSSSVQTDAATSSSVTSSSEYSEEDEDDEEDSSSSSKKRKRRKSSSDTVEENTATDGYIYIKKPEDVEVYFDGQYKGIAPLSFEKYAGTHVISLRKEGFVTKSYTITLKTNDDDETFSFDDLPAEDQ